MRSKATFQPVGMPADVDTPLPTNTANTPGAASREVASATRGSTPLVGKGKATTGWLSVMERVSVIRRRPGTSAGTTEGWMAPAGPLARRVDRIGAPAREASRPWLRLKTCGSDDL